MHNSYDIWENFVLHMHVLDLLQSSSLTIFVRIEQDMYFNAICLPQLWYNTSSSQQN